MSTQYPLFKKDDIELEADERSSKIHLNVCQQNGWEPHHTIPALQPEEVVGIALELLKVASYVGGSLKGMLEPYLRGRQDGDYYRHILKELME